MAEQQCSCNRRKRLPPLVSVAAGDWSRALHQLQLCARWEANYTCDAGCTGRAGCSLRIKPAAPFFRVNNDPVSSAAARLGESPAALACHDDTGEVDKHRNTALEAITQWAGSGTAAHILTGRNTCDPPAQYLSFRFTAAYIWLPFRKRWNRRNRRA